MSFPTLASTFAVVLAAQGDPGAADLQLYPAGNPVQRGDQRWLACRLVDDITGRPIRGGEIFLVDEHPTPLAGKFWFVRRAEGDEDGFVRVRVDDLDSKWSWVVVRANGYGPRTCMNTVDGLVWPLARAQEVPVLVHDWRGLPAPGVSIGFCGGCGHTPDLANAVANSDGLAILRGIDPHNHISDLYAQGETLDLGYLGFEWFPGDPPVRFECGLSQARTGKVQDSRGAPVSGAFVGTKGIDRGPWAQTGDDGSFTLLGCELESRIVVVLPDREVEFGDPGPSPLTLRLPEPDGSGFQQVPVAPVPAPLPPIGAPSTVSVGVRVRPVYSKDAVSVASPTVFLRTPAGSEDVTRTVAEKSTALVPATGPFALELAEGGASRIFAFASASEVPKTGVELKGFVPTLVSGIAVDAAGMPVAVRVRVVGWGERADGLDAETPPSFADGRFKVACRHTGLSLVVLRPEREDLRPRMAWTTLPARGDDARVDLGRLVLSASPALRVIGAAGSDPTRLEVRFARSGLHAAGDAPKFPLDATGAWLGPDLRFGDAILVTPTNPEAGAIPVTFRTVLSGAPPWTIRLPAGALDVSLKDEHGEPVNGVLFLADQAIEIAGRARLTQLPPGTQRVFVAAPGRRTTIATVEVPEQGAGAFSATLPPD